MSVSRAAGVAVISMSSLNAISCPLRNPEGPLAILIGDTPIPAG